MVGLVVLAGCSTTSTSGEPSRSSGSVTGTTVSPVGGTSPSGASDEIDGLFDVGGHKLYMNCQGTGSPTIVYLHGRIPDPNIVAHNAGVPIRDDLGGGYRMCVYDRRNVGSSETVDAPQSPDDAINDLHRLLAAVGVEPPYVLLGASFGGLLAYLYANRYPDEVVGMVLLDAMFPDDLLLDPLLPPKERYKASDQEDENASLERLSQFKVLEAAVPYIGKEPAIPVTYLASLQEPWGDTEYPKYDNVILDAQRKYVKRFAPGRFIQVDAPHFMEVAIPGRIATELETLIGSLPAS
jgi:pimeloyl-ACP methyl ester carboxylesterase